MYEDLNIDALKEAGLRGSRVRDGDDGFGWIDALRDVAAEEKSRRSSWGGKYASARLPSGYGAGKSGAALTPDRVGLLKEAQSKVDARKKAKTEKVAGPVAAPAGCSAGCGSDVTRWKGMCQSCYNRENRGSWRAGKYHKVYFGDNKAVFEMVQSMAREERRSVSEMVMVMLSSEVARRMQDRASAPPRKRYHGSPKVARASQNVTN